MHMTVSGSLIVSFLGLLVWTASTQAGPCESNFPAGNPDSVYIDHGDGTVTDMRTGLMWKQCAEGLDGAGCETGALQTFTWREALALADTSTFGGYTDWRLPNVKELFSLVEDCRWGPSINTNHFPNTPSEWFWSGSPQYADDTRKAWGVYFGDGHVSDWLRWQGYWLVRLVRGGQ